MVNGGKSKKNYIRKSYITTLNGTVLCESDYEFIETVAVVGGMVFDEENSNKAILTCPLPNERFCEGNELLLVVDLEIDGTFTTIKYPIEFPKNWTIPALEAT